MRKTGKKFLALLLALAAVLTLFAGCSGGTSASSGGSGSSSATEAPEPAESSESQSAAESSAENEAVDGETGKVDGEGYTVHYLYVVMMEGSNQQKVSEAVDALATQDLNMHVDLIPMTYGTYMQQLPMMLAANDPLDIFPGMSGSFSTYIEAQNIVDLTPYKEDLQDAFEVLGADAEAGTIGDFFVGTGQMKERGFPAGLVVRKDIFDELGYSVDDFAITVDDYSSFDQITALFATVKEKYPDMVVFDGTDILAKHDLSYMDNLGSDFGVLENYGQTTTVTNWFESEQFRTFCEIAKAWDEAGYLSKDIAVNQDTGTVKMRAGNTFSFMTNVKPNTNIEMQSQSGMEVEIIPLGKAMKNTNAVTATLFCIANASEDPKKAAQFLNWTYISREFNDLINWGIEGENWVENSDGMAEYPEGVDASTVTYHNDFGFMYPNQFIGHPWTGNDPDIWEQYQAYNDAMLTSKAFGFTFDSTPVADEEAALAVVRDQYWNELAFGAADDIDAKLQEFNDALYAAGLQAVMDEKQSQLDEWFAAQK